ncbi:cytochrome P450 family protein [Actinosynnema sp. ALI-1.44]|uniref:cytochrome P450 family protein n=1 Tax=Actinosynnema sp. ALI-1.44 TaxID=1933779 RepID=UPI00192D1D93|nr:cytochrome P450 [Actinosynnema sp. ALI-1.44]
MSDGSPFLETSPSARQAKFAELVESGPVHHTTLFTGVPVWLVTGHAETRQLLTHPNVVKSLTEVPHREHTSDDLIRATNTHMLASNPPDHTRLRKLVSAAFTRRRIDELEPRIKQLSASLLDEMATQGGPVDLLAGYGYPLPITVICELIGVPSIRRDEFRELSQIAMTGPMRTVEVYLAAVTKLIELIRTMIEVKRATPADDLLSALIAVRDDGDKLTDDELTSMIYLLLIAGHETTVNLIVNGVYTLLKHPEQLAALRADPSLVASAVEELLRYDSPVMVSIPAVTNGPVEIGDVTIPPGSVVLAALASANRDPHRFAAPDTMDITRPDNSHVTFGHGIHHCLGAPLARLEARIAFTDLLDRFPSLRLADPAEEPARYPGLLLNGMARLDVLID